MPNAVAKLFRKDRQGEDEGRPQEASQDAAQPADDHHEQIWNDRLMSKADGSTVLM